MAKKQIVSGDLPLGARKHAKSFKGTVSRTKQSFRDGTRIDVILKRYATLGVDATLAPALFEQGLARATFGVDLGKDYQQQLTAVTRVQQYFESLPSALRARFENSPAKFAQFVTDPANLEEGRKLGIFDPAPEEPDVAPAAPKVAPAAPAPSAPAAPEVKPAS